MKDTNNQQCDGGMFASIASLPLLKGVSLQRISDIVGGMKLHFFRASAGETFVHAGDACQSLIFVLSGSVRLEVAHGTDGSTFTVGQTLSAPQVIAPDNLFGLFTAYPCGVTALEPVGLMEITKEDYRRMLTLDPVFLFNYLNTVCAASQRSQSGLLAIAGGSAQERIAYWVSTLSQPGATDIEIRSTHREIHHLMGMSSAALRTAVEKLAPMLELPDACTLRAPSRAPLRSLLDE